MRERAGIGTGIAVFVVLMLLAFGACLAIADDDDDEDGMARVASRAEVEKSRKHRDRDDNNDHGSGDRSQDNSGKCRGADYCEDNDFSPDLEDSPVILCLPSSTCNFGEGEEALPPLDPRCAPFHCDPKPQSLMPPDPVKLMEAIQTFTKGVGEASGALAGAIAGGTIGILL